MNTATLTPSKDEINTQLETSDNQHKVAILHTAPIAHKNWQHSVKQWKEDKKRSAGKTHPQDQGVTMELHHILAEKTFKILDERIREKIERCHYDINQANNLVALPYDLKAACILHVQPHRGGHPKFYFKVAMDKIQREYSIGKLGRIIKEHANQSGTRVKACIQLELDKISEDMLVDIANFKLLTHKIGKDFRDGGKGCCGRIDVDDDIDNVTDEKAVVVLDDNGNLRKKSCKDSRDHEGDRMVSKVKNQIHIKYDEETGKYLELVRSRNKKTGKWQSKYEERTEPEFELLKEKQAKKQSQEIEITFNGTWELEVGI